MNRHNRRKAAKLLRKRTGRRTAARHAAAYRDAFLEAHGMCVDCHDTATRRKRRVMDTLTAATSRADSDGLAALASVYRSRLAGYAAVPVSEYVPPCRHGATVAAETQEDA